MNNYNLISYLIYLPVTFYITVFIGKVFYTNGIVFLSDAFNGNKELAEVLNKFLLVGYYLVNLGYAAISINTFSSVDSYLQLAEELSKRLGIIIIGLAVLHYFNMYTFSHFSKQIQKLYQHNQ
ncbi:MAG: hypothetical protein V4538_13370 [Bacteroidota bacterium]